MSAQYANLYSTDRKRIVKPLTLSNFATVSSELNPQSEVKPEKKTKRRAREGNNNSKQQAGPANQPASQPARKWANMPTRTNIKMMLKRK